MYRFGIAGIPLSSKGRTLRDGIEDMFVMGLNAMEIQFLKVEVIEKEALEEIGFYPREVVPDKKEESKFILNINRANESGNYVPIGIDAKIEETDILQILQWNFAKSYAELRDLRRLAKELDIKLTIHTPYYIDLIYNPKLIERSINYILWTSYLGAEMGAEMIITNMGLYDVLDSEEALQRVSHNLNIIRKMLKKAKLDVVIGLETSEKQEVFGTIDELITLANNHEKTVPIINFAKLFARNTHQLRKSEDFKELLERVMPYHQDDLYFQFAGVEYSADRDLRIAPVKKGDLRFEVLAGCLLEFDQNITIISNSPLLEHDAQYMRIILERKIGDILAKKVKK